MPPHRTCISNSNVLSKNTPAQQKAQRTIEPMVDLQNHRETCGSEDREHPGNRCLQYPPGHTREISSTETASSRITMICYYGCTEVRLQFGCCWIRLWQHWSPYFAPSCGRIFWNCRFCPQSDCFIPHWQVSASEIGGFRFTRALSAAWASLGSVLSPPWSWTTMQ